MSLRNEAGFDKLETFEGKRIDYVTGGELRFEHKGLKLEYRNAFSKDFLQAHNFQVGYTAKLAEDTPVTIDSRFFRTKKDGDLWTGSAWYAPAFDNDAQYVSLNAEIKYQGLTFLAAIAKTDADSTQGLGKYYYDFGKNTHGIWNGKTSAYGEDFLYDDEVVYRFGGVYDLSEQGIEGLVIGCPFHYASGMTANNGHEGSEYEHDFLLEYTFPQESLKGLSYKVEYGLYKNDTDLQQTIGYGRRNDLRTWLDYKFVAF